MQEIEEMIVEYIDEHLMNPDSATQFYLEASKFGNKTWEQKALNILSMNFEQISKSEKDIKILLDLPFESFLNMVSREDLYVSSEDPVLELVVKYITDRELSEDRNPLVPG